MSKVLVVATSRKTRGGITSVVKAHETGGQWKKYHCRWIETHRDGNAARKLWYLITALVEYVVLLPFYDIVHIHIATLQSARRKRLFYCLAKFFNKKVIFHFHPSNEKFLADAGVRKLYRKLFLGADLILVLSEQWRRWLKQYLDITDRVEVLYNPCPVVERSDVRRPYILFAGTLIPRKGYADLIQAFARIAKKYPDWRVKFAGNGELQKAKRLAESLDISNQVELLGWVQGNDKDTLFKHASVYCLASDGEGFPMGILDAWAYGIPCVVTPVGGIPDIVENGRNGLLFDVHDIGRLSGQLECLICNQELQKSIVQESDKYVYGDFCLKNIHEHLSMIYARIKR